MNTGTLGKEINQHPPVPGFVKPDSLNDARARQKLVAREMGIYMGSTFLWPERWPVGSPPSPGLEFEDKKNPPPLSPSNSNCYIYTLHSISATTSGSVLTSNSMVSPPYSDRFRCDRTFPHLRSPHSPSRTFGMNSECSCTVWDLFFCVKHSSSGSQSVLYHER